MKMLRSSSRRLLKHCCRAISSRRNSALFLNGLKATETFAFVSPHIDFPEQINQEEIILEHLKIRKSDIDFTKVKNLWSVYNDLKQRKASYDEKKSAISSQLSKLMKEDPSSEEVNKLKIQLNLLKDNVKKLKVPLWSAEEAAIVEYLKIPNALHPRTPNEDTEALYTHLSPPNNNKNHLKLATKLDLIHFIKNEIYYLKNDAAIFELGAKFYFSKILKENKFIQFSNTDFVKSVIIEGCGQDHRNPDETFILHHHEDSKVSNDNRLHLTGGASLAAFLAYHGKNVTIPKALPLKYFTMGRQYIPCPSEEDSLFHVSQSSVIQIFGAAKNETQSDTLLEDVIELIKSMYSALGWHFRVCSLPAHKLLMWESARISIEMYSTSLKSYIEVGNVSLCGDFISKRLMFTYSENKQSLFPHLLSGTILNIPKLLGCILEQDTDFSIPECMKIDEW